MRRWPVGAPSSTAYPSGTRSSPSACWSSGSGAATGSTCGSGSGWCSGSTGSSGAASAATSSASASSSGSTGSGRRAPPARQAPPARRLRRLGRAPRARRRAGPPRRHGCSLVEDLGLRRMLRACRRPEPLRAVAQRPVLGASSGGRSFRSSVSNLQVLVVEPVPELLTFGLEVAQVLVVRRHLDRHLLGDRQPVRDGALELPRVVRQQADRRQAEVGEDLVADPVLARVGGEAEREVRLDGVAAPAPAARTPAACSAARCRAPPAPCTGARRGSSAAICARRRSSCSPQSQRSEWKTSPVRHSEWTRTSTSSRAVDVAAARARRGACRSASRGRRSP